jgi:crotonobetainyl-CoA:carnitine CoA-transferase CaiB-like acyl-CoA transferase
MIDGHAGLSVLQGYPDDVARKGGIAWPDPLAGLHAAFATLVALHLRLTEPGCGGATVEVAQLEATVSVVGHAVLARQLGGAEPVPDGSRDPHLAPQGVYPCRGEDAWVAVSVVDDRMWRALCAAAGMPAAWAAWDVAARHIRHDDIDAALGAWTAAGDAVERASTLRTAGVAAEPVADAAMVMADPHLAARGAFVSLRHPEAGTHRWPRLAVRLHATPATYRRPAPCLGEHRREVLATLAGYDAVAVDALEETGVIVDRPPQ